MSKELRRADLPVHPRTGLRAVGVVAGRPVWPILGGDENSDATANETAAARALREYDETTQALRGQILEFESKGDLSEDDTKRFDTLTTDYDAREAARKPLAERVDRMAKIREQFEAGQGVEDADETEGTSRSDNGGSSSTTTRSSASNSGGSNGRGRTRRTNPFENYQTTRSMAVGEVTTRARQSLEQCPDWQLSDTQRAHVERALLSDRSGVLARHIMAGQNPDYVSAFDKFVGGDTQLLSLTESERAAVAFTSEIKRGILEGTNSAGGFLVPPYFDPTVIHTTEDSVNPIRQLVDQRTITGPKYTAPTMGGVSAGYVGEAVEIGESVPTYGQFSVTVQKAGAYIKMSTEANEDTAAAAELPGLLQEAKDEWEAHEFLLGDGAAGHIRGILTALIAADAAAPSNAKLIFATAAAGVYSVNDIYTVLGQVPARYRQQLKWLAAYEFYLRARTLAGNNNLGAFWTDLNGDNPPEIAGKPTYEASQMPSAAVGTNYTAGQLVAVAGDFRSAYLIVDRRGMVVQYDPMVKGPNGRPTGEVGWYATWRTGGDMRLPRALRGLKSS